MGNKSLGRALCWKRDREGGNKPPQLCPDPLG